MVVNTISYPGIFLCKGYWITQLRMGYTFTHGVLNHTGLNVLHYYTNCQRLLHATYSNSSPTPTPTSTLTPTPIPITNNSKTTITTTSTTITTTASEETGKTKKCSYYIINNNSNNNCKDGCEHNILPRHFSLHGVLNHTGSNVLHFYTNSQRLLHATYSNNEGIDKHLKDNTHTQTRQMQITY